MKCGICGKSQSLDYSDLARHKRLEHPVEVGATAQKRYNTRIDNRRREAAIDAAVRLFDLDSGGR